MRMLQRKYVWVITTIILGLGYAVSCTRSDQVLDTPAPINSSTDLVAVKTSTSPTIDGTVDALWANSPTLEFGTQVPEVTGDVFRGYTGNIMPSVKMRSTYDDNNIYLLIEWADPTKSLKRQPWYFNPTTKKWGQEKGTYDFDPATGAILRNPFYEDKIAFFWNVNGSVNGWNNGTCYKTCHTGLPSIDGSSRHFTNFSTEKVDIWHWKSVRGGVNASSQIHDQYMDNTYPNGRKGDPGVDIYQNNKQTLSITGGTGTMDVPKYVIPNKTDYGWIMNTEVASGTAKQVTAVDVNGVLTLSDNTTIDPNVGTDYQRSGLSGLGAKAIPGVTLNDGYTGSAGDISCKTVFTDGKGWTMEIKRALKTSDEANDVDFTSLKDQYFGFAVFENAQIAHSIKTNLVLKFKK